MAVLFWLLVVVFFFFWMGVATVWFGLFVESLYIHVYKFLIQPHTFLMSTFQFSCFLHKKQVKFTICLLHERAKAKEKKSHRLQTESIFQYHHCSFLSLCNLHFFVISCCVFYLLTQKKDLVVYWQAPGLHVRRAED